MKKTARTVLISALLGAMSLLGVIALAINYPESESALIAKALANLALIISVLTFCVSAVGMASTVALSWRSDKRQSQESSLKIQQLELQLAEMRKSIEGQSGQGLAAEALKVQIRTVPEERAA